jgi:hypothetical protein
MRAFIVRPFGTKDGINFDHVQKTLIDPALQRARIAGDTTAEIVQAGNIRIDMFELLLLADLVIADISIHNANVFYELGIRHALRSRQTVLMRAKVTKPPEQRGSQDEVPFDLRTDRYFEYDAANPGASIDTLVQVLTMTGASERVDSPVFLSLPELGEQDRSRLAPLPREFKEEVDKAFGLGQIGRLALLRAETGGVIWQMEGLRIVARAQRELRAYASAATTLQEIRDGYPDDIESNLLLGTVFQRLGKLKDSEAALRRVMNNPDTPQQTRAEALALVASNEKAKLTQQWPAMGTSERRQHTLRSPHLLNCYESYKAAYFCDLNHYYSGLNALAWITVATELIQSYPNIWAERFDSEGEADIARVGLLAQRGQLFESVGVSIEATKARMKGGTTDVWLSISEADYKFLISKRPQQAAAGYRQALAVASTFEADTARTQLETYKRLELFSDKVAECLTVFPTPSATNKEDSSPTIRQVIVFTGHMIDAPERQQPRFPATCEEEVREAIRSELQNIIADPRNALGIAGGACGGDILFHEECARLGVRTRLRLSLPPGSFIARSVTHAGGDWVSRFRSLMYQHGESIEILAEDEDLPAWLRGKAHYDIWQRTNVWLLEEALSVGAPETALIALWDGEPGDGPGGTQHLVETANLRGVRVAILPIQKICSNPGSLEL